MRKEVDPNILSWLDEQRIRQGQPNLTTLLERLGVRILNEKDTLYAWGWRRSGNPSHIITIWSEDIVVNANGKWEVEESFQPSGNPHFNLDQIQREAERIALLKEISKSEAECKIILMVNRKSREESANGISAEAEFRVIDNELWHVNVDSESGRILLCRGARNSDGDASSAENTTDNDDGIDPEINFPDQEWRKQVEIAAIEHAKDVYADSGIVRSVESENLGYDLAVSDRLTGELKFKVEVKGTASEIESFFLTRNELKAAHADPARWRLVIVLDALESPTLQEYTASQMESNFRLDPLVFHCASKSTAAPQM